MLDLGGHHGGFNGGAVEEVERRTIKVTGGARWCDLWRREERLSNGEESTGEFWRDERRERVG